MADAPKATLGEWVIEREFANIGDASTLTGRIVRTEAAEYRARRDGPHFSTATDAQAALVGLLEDQHRDLATILDRERGRLCEMTGGTNG